MALLQCVDYLDQHKWKLVETEDTALSAKNIAQKKNHHAAAIAGIWLHGSLASKFWLPIFIRSKTTVRVF